VSSGLASAPAAELLVDGRIIWVYRLAGALPRAALYVAEAAVAGAKQPGGQPPGDFLRQSSSSLSMGGRRTTDRSPCRHRRLPATRKFESSRPSRVELITTSTAESLLVLHDLYYPGWIAEVDGKPTPILRPPSCSAPSFVPAGRHQVTFASTRSRFPISARP